MSELDRVGGVSWLVSLIFVLGDPARANELEARIRLPRSENPRETPRERCDRAEESSVTSLA